jgi:hypothetical protein
MGALGNRWCTVCSLLVLFTWCTRADSQDTKTRRPDEPWLRRERKGVVVEAMPIQLGAQVPRASSVPNEVSLQEIRRLGLRPVSGNQPLRPWPPEPASPAAVDVARFGSALAQLCADTAVDALAEALLSASAAFNIDPFLLGAVAYHQSECRPHRADAYGIGLTRINLGMFQRGMRQGAYHYGKPDGRGGFDPAVLPVERYPFTPATLRNAKPNAYFAAAMISVLAEQCPAVDAMFASVPHRHHVSHFVFGDRVRSTLPEDEILIARRRLLQYYVPYNEPPRARAGGVALTCPLDAPPRLAIGLMGEPREDGKRIHLGLDLAASQGEPVRAMAPGVVEFAGVDLRHRGFVQMPSVNAEQLALASMGPRGIFVRVRHDDGVQTLYVHLQSFSVQAGHKIERGELLGRVGRSGVHTSEAHLHLGIFVDELPIDPLPVLGSYVIRADRSVPSDAADQPM